MTRKNRSHVDSTWLKKDWKIVAGLTYIIINVFDFIIFPIFFALLPVIDPRLPFTPWHSLTLTNGGLFHMAFAAILGVSIWKNPSFTQASSSAEEASAEESRYSEPMQPKQPDQSYQQPDPTQSTYDPNIYAGPDNYTDWNGNPIKH